MDRYQIKEIGTERRFCVETKAKTLNGLKRACAWIGNGKFYLEGGNVASTKTTEQLNAWLREGI